VRIALAWAGAGVAIGAAGLVIDAALIFPSMSVVSPTNPVARSFLDTFIYFWTYFTHLTNLWLLVCYLAWITDWRWLSLFRRPTMLASAAAFITLVMLFYHFLLAPYIRMEGRCSSRPTCCTTSRRSCTSRGGSSACRTVAWAGAASR
jgi:hypothetical protein